MAGFDNKKFKLCFEGLAHVAKIMKQLTERPSAETDHTVVLNTALQFCCKVPGKVALIQLLLDHGVDVTVADNKGVSPLMTACQFSPVSIVKQLITRGGDVQAKDKTGRTVVHYCCLRTNTKSALEIIEFLRTIVPGLNVDVADDEHITPLHLTCSANVRETEKENCGTSVEPCEIKGDGAGENEKRLRPASRSV